ncbi:MAG: hypothetical protein M3321_09035 [Actinomycetota bacterium]|nr:hypothetical protein [Actinomycetota bacterium]
MADTYLAFVWTPTGYQLREKEGEPPTVGDEVDDDGTRLRVFKVAPSPLPGDDRLCAYLQG